jgi:hypothetical protein
MDADMLIASWPGIIVELTERRRSRPSEAFVVSIVTADGEAELCNEKDVLLTRELDVPVTLETYVVVAWEAVMLAVKKTVNPMMMIIAIATRAEAPSEMSFLSCNFYCKQGSTNI